MTRTSTSASARPGSNPTALAAGPLPPARGLPTRRSRPALWLAGLLAVVVSALGVAALVRSVGSTHPYLAVAHEVPVGDRIDDGDLAVVEINSAAGLRPIAAAERASVVGSYAKATLMPGTLLVRDQVTDQQVPGTGQTLVSINLKPEAQPARPLTPGDRLLLVVTADAEQPSQDGPKPLAPPATFQASVHKVGDPTPAGDVAVDVVLSKSDGPTVAGLAAAGRIVPILAAGA